MGTQALEAAIFGASSPKGTLVLTRDILEFFFPGWNAALSTDLSEPVLGYLKTSKLLDGETVLPISKPDALGPPESTVAPRTSSVCNRAKDLTLYTSAWALALEPPGPCTRDPRTKHYSPVGKHKAQGSDGSDPPTRGPPPTLGIPGSCSQRPQDLYTPTNGPALATGPVSSPIGTAPGSPM